jgi:carboxyl-terminal processing protease
MKLFDNLLVLVEENYATRVDPERAVYGAIDGMLRTLDPHSKFFDPKSFKQLREDQTGKYAGLGISVTMRFNRITVASPPFAESPAERAGLRVGDVISQVNGEPTDGLVTDEVVSLLRGRPGTAVNVTISRPGVPQPLEFRIVRQEIKRYTINHAYEIRPGIGYIKIDSFAETTGRELQEALRKLDSRRLDGLVLDLRNNPGGLLTEAITVSGTFLKRGQSILKTGGRTEGSTREFNAEQRDPEPPYPLVVLLNQNSASASEIVAGAIQDHDRGLIVGETSFGKGLVQSVYTLRNNSGADTGLALTTQKWYTPSGRLIQRDYSQISNFDYMYHRDGPQPEQERDKKFSDSGRVVYGGGGITPDFVVPAQKLTEFQTSLLFEKFAFFSFMQQVVAKTPAIDKTWQVTDAVLADFKQHLRDRRIDFTEQQFEENKDFIKFRIQYEVYYSRLGTVEAQKVMNEGDVQVLKAIELLPEARKLQSQGPVVTAER